jgi:hypothetical protein
MELPLIWTKGVKPGRLVYNAKLERVIAPTCIKLDRASADILYGELKRAEEIRFKGSSDFIVCVDYVEAYELMTTATLDNIALWRFVQILGGRLAGRICIGRIALMYVVASYE